MDARKIIDTILITLGEVTLEAIEPWAKPYKGSVNLLAYPVADLRKILKKLNNNTRRNSLRRLSRLGLIIFTYKKDRKYLRLTKKGVNKIQQLLREELINEAPRPHGRGISLYLWYKRY